jgi:hypothetical protein
MKTIFSFFLLLAIISCSKDSSENENSFANVQNQIAIKFLNSNNENLFETSTLNHFEISNVKLYNIINDIPIEVGIQYGNVELTQNLPLKLIIFSNINPSNGGVLISENGNSKIYEFNSLLKLSDTITDSIKTNIEFVTENGSTSVSVKTIWYNDKLVADNYLSFFDIVK